MLRNRSKKKNTHTHTYIVLADCTHDNRLPFASDVPKWRTKIDRDRLPEGL